MWPMVANMCFLSDLESCILLWFKMIVHIEAVNAYHSRFWDRVNASTLPKTSWPQGNTNVQFVCDMFLCYIIMLCSIANMYPKHNKIAYSFSTRCTFKPQHNHKDGILFYDFVYLLANLQRLCTKYGG